MNFAEFAGNNPWALTILKSDLLIRLVEELEKPRSVEYLVATLRPLTRQDIERALNALQKLGVVEKMEDLYVLSTLGKQFLEAYRTSF